MRQEVSDGNIEKAAYGGVQARARSKEKGVKRNLFSELTEGFDALKAPREGKRTLRTNERTLENWEQGRARPNAQAAQLIRLVAHYPDTVKRLAAV